MGIRVGRGETASDSGCQIALVAPACPSGSLDGDEAEGNDGHIGLSVITLSDRSPKENLHVS